MKRIFVGIKTPELLQQKILAWKTDFLDGRPSFAKATDGKVRWLKGKNLHITLVPPWYEEAEKIASRELQIEKAVADFKPFELNFKKLMFGPDPKNPRLILAEGPDGDSPRSSEGGAGTLKATRDKILNEIGKEPEKRPLKLHLTVARFRPEEFSGFPIKKLEEEIDWKLAVNSVILYESQLAHGGAEYEILKEFKLLL